MLRFVNDLLLRLRFREKGMLLVLIPLIFEILFVALLSTSYRQAEQESLEADHGRYILTLTDEMTTALFAVGATLFVGGHFRKASIEERYASLQQMLDGLGQTLLSETAPYPEEAKFAREIVTDLEDLSKRGAALRELLADPLQVISGIEIQSMRKGTKRSLERLGRSLDELIAYEKSISGKRLHQSQRARQSLHLLLYGGVVLNVLLSVGLALLFSGQVTKRLAALSRNAVSMSRKQELAETLGGTDELSDVDKLMHQLSGMLIETSRRERAMMDNVSEVICALSPERVLLSVNAAASTALGWSDAEIIGLTASDLVVAEHRALLNDELEKCRNSGAASVFECSLMCRNGTLMESRWSALWSSRDQSYFCIIRDVGAEKDAERLRQKFFSMVTHDLRSPISSIGSFLQMLADGNYGRIEQGGLDKVRLLQSNIDFVTKLSEDLLEIGRVNSGHLRLARDNFDMDVLVDECCSSIEFAANAKSINLAVEITGPCKVTADFVRLKQVLVNLLVNAIKFSPEGSTIKLAAGISGEPPELRVSVTDSGPGIPAEQIDSVFDLYSQVENSGQASKGFGVGLSIVKAVISAHQGKVGVDSVLGKGSEFWFVIPAIAEIKESEAIVDESASPGMKA